MREPEGRRLRHAAADERAHCDAMTVRFEHETRIEAPAKLVFDLSLDIYAHRALMAASNERAIAGMTSGPIGLGDTVTWRAIHFRIPFTMTSRVTELERRIASSTTSPSHSAARRLVERLLRPEPAGHQGRTLRNDGEWQPETFTCASRPKVETSTQPGFTVMGVPQDRSDCVRPVWRPRGTERTVATRRRRS